MSTLKQNASCAPRRSEFKINVGTGFGSPPCLVLIVSTEEVIHFDSVRDKLFQGLCPENEANSVRSVLRIITLLQRIHGFPVAHGKLHRCDMSVQFGNPQVQPFLSEQLPTEIGVEVPSRLVGKGTAFTHALPAQLM